MTTNPFRAPAATARAEPAGVTHALSEYVPDRSACGYMSDGDRIGPRGAQFNCSECAEVLILVSRARSLRLRDERSVDAD